MERILLISILCTLALVGVFIWTQPRHKTAVISLVKNPHAFETWIMYHLEKMGVSKFYIFLDDDDENIDFQHPSINFQKNWKERLGFNFDPKLDEPANVRVKQHLIVNEGLRMAQEDGIDYVVHIDSDELLYGPKPVSDVLKSYPADAFHMKNTEMAPDRKDYKNCFLEGTWFHGDPGNFIAYGNGKGAGAVGRSEPYGPHYFKGERTVEIPETELKVLHYPSCNIEETLKRAKNYGDFKDDSAGWSDHHKETRDALKSCGSECREKAEAQFEKRMAGPDSYQIDIGYEKTSDVYASF